MMAAEEGKRRRGMRCDQTGRCQEWEPGEQEEVERGQPEAGIVGRAGPGFLGLADCGLVHHGFPFVVNLLVDHHPVAVRRVAHLAHA